MNVTEIIVILVIIFVWLAILLLPLMYWDRKQKKEEDIDVTGVSEKTIFIAKNITNNILKGKISEHILINDSNVFNDKKVLRDFKKFNDSQFIQKYMQDDECILTNINKGL